MRTFNNYLSLCSVVILLSISSCAINPVTGKKQIVLMSEAQEIAMGQQSDPEIVAFFGLYEDAQLQEFITAKGNEMAAISHRPKLAYEFKIVDSPVINAFAVPGGFVYFTRGIMAHFNNEAEFAGVLGHEIGHVTARHSVIQQRNQLFGQIGLLAGIILVPELGQFVDPLSQGMQLALLKFGRDAERQSDKLGVEYSSQIGYDATEMAGFFETLERQQGNTGGDEVPPFLSTHPSPEERNATVENLALDWQQKSKMTEFEVNRDSYLRKIDGLIVGEDPKQGFVENSTFYHPVLKIQFPIPSAWGHQNTPQQFQMAPKAGDAIMMLTLAPGATLEEAANAVLEKYKLTIVESKKETINRLPALVMVADQVQEQGTIRVLSSLIQFEGNIYSLMGITDLAKFNSYQSLFLSTIRDFQELRDSEKLNRKPEIIKIKTVPNQMSLQAAFQHFGMPSERFEELSLLNGMHLNDQLNKGMLIKVVGK
ncbi:M48 family metalloprotease [Algoriphagus aquimarinus]|uniref:Putative Zn-dependent protease n=1 Tax=Algoriphagus aquimarinus TaxID=237018 RepID=A0A1I1B1U2_9BACT|nr:M48 family metalloprotease [Algoriphagus aquimarinus]SFB44221.1 Putative Zn-dependent protease [Algoriphagus aquimarinus]